MTKNAKAAMPSNEELVALVISLKADKEAAEKRAAEAEAKAAKVVSASIALSAKGGINVTLPAGKGSITMHFYAWHWAKISEMRADIDAFAKKNADKLTTEAAFRASKV
jgi:cytoskeletal protein RodZ